MKRRTRAGLLGAALLGAGFVTVFALSPQAASTSPLASAVPHVREGQGLVVERLQAGHYGYLRLQTEPAESWLVAMGPAPAIGTTLKFRTYAVSTNFYSPRLKRRFERLHFSSITPQGKSQ